MVLANHFKDQAVSQGTPRILRFSDEALAYMDNYNWPGNVRELKSAVERALVNCSGEEIGPAHLELGSGIMQSNPKQQDGTYAPLTLADYQKYALAMALHHSGGLQSKAAKLLGISPKKIGYQINYRE